MDEERPSLPRQERVEFSGETMEKRWKFILEEACVAKEPTGIKVIIIVFGVVCGAFSIAACLAGGF